MDAELFEVEVLDEGCDCSEDVCACCTGGAKNLRAA